jgi:nicotinamide riboside kinase
MKEKGYSRDTIGSLQMQEDIMEAHFLLEQESMVHAVRVCDRTAIDPIVYAILTSRDEEESRRKQDHLTRSANFQKALQQYRKSESIVILLKPVAEWLIDDGIRSTENQDKCLQIYRRLLAEMDVPYYEFGREMMFLPERVGFIMGLARL